ncbi:hypothetical protein EDC01DRAFT_631449 [Geopyxis carbonaria]|nr:hypothetical protein EDC01DRAFT_631449 [Geopyxis carbonaria]
MLVNSYTRWDWGANPNNQLQKRPRKKCKHLKEVLLEFPDPSSLERRSEYGSASSKQEDTLQCLTERHKEQRRRLIERHTLEYDLWVKDSNRQIDVAILAPDNPTFSIINYDSDNVFHAVIAQKSLELLPASDRNIFVCNKQFEKAQLESYENPHISPIGLAAVIARQAVQFKMQMLNEEQQLRMFQHESKALFYEAMMRSNPEKYPKDLKGKKSVVRPVQTSVTRAEPTVYKAPPVKTALDLRRNSEPSRDPRLQGRS